MDVAACQSQASVFLTLINTLFVTQCLKDPSDHYPENYVVGKEDEFDFIIVGAGAAGSVVANRLSESHTVLLLEAGGYPTADTEVPAFFPDHQRTHLDWLFTSEPSPNACLGVDDGRCLMPAGRILGGSSTLSYNCFFRGAPSDFEEWGSGNPGWNASDAARYYKKINGINSEGPLKLAFEDSKSTLRDYLIKSAGEAGFPVLRDEGTGFFQVATTIIDGKGFNVAKAYLSPIKERGNLKLALNALVTKIVFEGSTAVGVEVVINNKIKTVRARKEVIASAGAINSPKLLLLSGLGPKDQLESLKIPVVNDLPVGENFQDHVEAIGVVVKINPIDTYDVKSSLQSYYEYCLDPMSTSSSLGDLGATTLWWNFNTEDKPDPNILVFHYPIAANDSRSVSSYFLNQFNILNSTMQQLIQLNKNYQLINVGPTLVDVKSRGTIRLKSKDPFEPPLVDPGYFTHPDDMKTLVDAMRNLRKYLGTPTMQSLGAELVKLNLPGCEELDVDSDEYWECNFRSVAGSIYDYGGSNKMGADGVVDERLKVHGVQGLRVIDASIMPKLARSNLLGPTLVIAEKGADLIKEDYV